MAQIAYRSPGAFQRYRWKELTLFIVPFLILLVEMTQVNMAAQFDAKDTLNLHNLPIIQGLTPVIGLIICLVAVNVVLSIFFRKTDQVLLPLVGMLSGLGVLMATRLGPDINFNALGQRQLLFVIIGLVLCVATIFVLRNTNFLERYKYTWALLSIILISPSVIQGIRTLHTAAPTHDNLRLGPIDFQPSELLKITLVIFFAAYLNENRDVIARGFIRLGFLRLPPLRQLGPLVLMLGISLMIFLVVRELGLAMLIYGLFLCMTYLTSGKITGVAVNLAIFAVLAAVGYILLPYVRQRFAAVSFDVVNSQNWTKAQDDFARGDGGQVLQGLISVASGGIFGAGFGLGHPTLNTPDATTDMVLTSFAEEFGLVGLFAIIAIYLLIVYRGFRIAIEASDTFSKLLAAGLTSVFAIQTLIICAGNLKIMPLTGIPLPFLCYGGSSVIANFIIIGILLRISHNTAMERDEID